MNSLVWLKRVLEASVKRNGEKPLTNEYLLNIVNMAIKAEDVSLTRAEQAMNEALEDDRRWGV